MLKTIFIIAVLGLCVSAKKKAKAKTSNSLYEFANSYVTSITKLNFDAQIKKIRETTKNVGIVHYYKASGIYLKP